MGFTTDRSLAIELMNYADNTYTLYANSFVPCVKNLERKSAKGVYDFEKSIKLMEYHANTAAKAYVSEEKISTPWHKVFSVNVRKEAAKMWAEYIRAEFIDGENSLLGS